MAVPVTMVNEPPVSWHGDRVGVGPRFVVGVGGGDRPDHAVGRADGGEVAGIQGQRCGAVTPVDQHDAGAGGEVGDVGALVGVDEGPEQDGAGRRCPRFR